MIPLPSLEIFQPEIPLKLKTGLTTAFSNAFAKVTDFERVIFGVRFVEYLDGGASQGGTLWYRRKVRSHIHFLLQSPSIRRTCQARG